MTTSDSTDPLEPDHVCGVLFFDHNGDVKTQSVERLEELTNLKLLAFSQRESMSSGEFADAASNLLSDILRSRVAQRIQILIPPPAESLTKVHIQSICRMDSLKGLLLRNFVHSQEDLEKLCELPGLIALRMTSDRRDILGYEEAWTAVRSAKKLEYLSLPTPRTIGC